MRCKTYHTHHALLCRIGRKKALVLYSTIKVIGGFGSAFAPSYWFFAFARMIMGCGATGCFLAAFVIREYFARTLGNTHAHSPCTLPGWKPQTHTTIQSGEADVLSYKYCKQGNIVHALQKSGGGGGGSGFWILPCFLYI